MAIKTFEQYYSDNCTQLVLQLAKKIGSLQEAEDRVQNIFMSLIPRKEFCDELIEKGELEKYIQGAINRQPAQALREQYKQVPTVSIDPDNIDFLSSIRDTQHGGDVTDEVELNDFYERASVKLLGNTRLLCERSAYETVGELRQYVFVQYCRNNRTFPEIGKLLGLSHQEISRHFGGIVTTLTPMIEAFIGQRLNNLRNDLQEPDN